MQYKGIPPWKTTPFLRIIFPLLAGIICQFYLEFAINILIVLFCAILLMLAGISFLSVNIKFRLKIFNGIFLQLLIFCIACIFTFKSDARNSKNWYGNFINDSSVLIIKLNEPLVKKRTTGKAEAKIEFVINEKSYEVEGKILVYFTKDEKVDLKYGQRIIINKKLIEIQNSGNPGAFDYRRYSKFQGIFQSVFLGPNDYKILDLKPSYTKTLLFSSRNYILKILSKHIKDGKVLGIAEALLIGYKENLDKDLLQAYSNTGVVHIIAISGLHLGLIYIVLVWLCNRIKFLKKNKFLNVFFILTCLWLFSFLTGGSASVLRSALMFSCILIGTNYFKKSSTYNTMAASAFLLLCYNPFYLWDVGFLLSYLAVLGIVWIQYPLYHSLYIKNKHLRSLWNMVSVTVAAQIMAFPLCIYFFHQFPNMFILTNVVAVPLSTIILFAELFLVIFSWLPLIEYVGMLTGFLLKMMNSYIEWCDSFPFSVTDFIYADVLSTWLLYGIVLCLCSWIIFRNKKYFAFVILFSLTFICNYTYENYKAVNQSFLVIYNVPGKKAIDFFSGKQYFFSGDSSLQKNGMLRNFHLKPGRIKAMSKECSIKFSNLKQSEGFINFNGKKILNIDSTLKFEPQLNRINVDILLISNNTKNKIKDILIAVSPQVIVLDGTNNLWTIATLKKECEDLHLRYHSVSQDGAFILFDH